MTLEDFVKKWEGKSCEIAGATAPNQCVDCANAYLRDVLGLPIIEWTNAQDFPTSPNGVKYFDFIKNTPEGVPQKGDLVIWKSSTYGHIAIFLSGDVNWFTSFDQNWPVGSYCHKVDHAYTNVIGWMRTKGENMTDKVNLDKETFEKLVNNSSKWDKVVAYLELATDPSQTTYEDVMNKIKGYKARETELTGKIKELEAKEINLTEQVSRLKEQLATEQKLYSALSDKQKSMTAEQEKALGLLQGRIEDLQGQVDQLGSDKGKLNEQIKSLEAKLGYSVLLEIKFLKLALVKKV